MSNKNVKKALFVEKVGMTSVFDDKGEVFNVTVLKVIPSVCLDVKSVDKHGYSAVLLGYGDVKDTKLNKPDRGFFDKKSISPKKHLREVRMDADYVSSFDSFSSVTDSSSDNEESVLNDKNIHSVFSLDAFVDEGSVLIRGLSKGKGFSGTIKAHNFARGPETHGSKNIRKPGSIGAGTDPARVFKGTKMAKRLGHKNVTVKRNLFVVDSEAQLLYVVGSVPGPKKSNHILYC